MIVKKKKSQWNLEKSILGCFARVWLQAKEGHWLSFPSFHGAEGWTLFACECHPALVFLICACPCKCYQLYTCCEIGSWRSAVMNCFFVVVVVLYSLDSCRVSGPMFVPGWFCSDKRNDPNYITSSAFDLDAWQQCRSIQTLMRRRKNLART